MFSFFKKNYSGKLYGSGDWYWDTEPFIADPNMTQVSSDQKNGYRLADALWPRVFEMS